MLHPLSFAYVVQIKELATRYSEFISFPIEVWAEKTSYDQVPDTDAEVVEGEEPKMKTVTRTSMQWEVRTGYENARIDAVASCVPVVFSLLFFLLFPFVLFYLSS